LHPDNQHERPHAHRFEDAVEWANRFEDPARDEWQKPELLLTRLQLSPASRVADIGSATGYFAVRIALAVPTARVWGVDIEPNMVRYLNQRARREKLDNLFSVLGTTADPLIPELVDRILVVDTYHHIVSRVAYFRRTATYLSPGGRLYVVDFKRGQMPVGPPDSMKVPPSQIVEEMSQAGFRRVGEDQQAFPYQFVLVFERAP
jgi:cyclopropane fatty-acyl-phospholipid synthase-like methyltransferase